MKTTWLHSMVQGDATQYYRKRNGIMVEHMVRPANFDMRYNHFHQEYEIYLLLRGRRQMFFENRAYEAQAGNLILVDSGQIHMSHSIVGDPETEYERVILYVDRDIVEKVDKMFPELKIGAFFHKHYGIYELTPKQTANTRRLFLQSRPRAFLRNAAVSAHSRLPMHTAVVASIGTTLPEQPCPAISCAKHAKAAAVTATPSTPKSRNERSSAGKPRDSDITKPPPCT